MKTREGRVRNQARAVDQGRNVFGSGASVVAQAPWTAGITGLRAPVEAGEDVQVAVRRPEDLGRVGAPVVGTLERNDGLGGRERTTWLGKLADNGRERLQGPFVLQRRREETGLALEKVAEGMAAPLELDVIVHDDGRLKDLERLRPCHDTEARYEQPQKVHARIEDVPVCDTCQSQPPIVSA